MPADGVMERASDLTRAATALGAVSGKAALLELRALLRSRNSYYTNRIEGEHTRPSDVERALQRDFSSNADLARKQRLAVAHIRTEQRCEAELDRQRTAQGDEAARSLYSTDALTWLHRELFSDLPAEDLRLADGRLLVPGQIREHPVAVGRHEAPVAASLPGFVARWAEVYARTRRGEAAIVALAAAHHRLAWMHPFLDGNGRVTRLHTHLLLQAWGLTNGLWSPLRGFARTEERYKALLQAADEHRQGDLDGRGNLSRRRAAPRRLSTRMAGGIGTPMPGADNQQAGLMAWIGYALDVCIDQIEFMARQLDIHGMRDRIGAALAFEASAVRSGVRAEALVQAERGGAAVQAPAGAAGRTKAR